MTQVHNALIVTKAIAVGKPHFKRGGLSCEVRLVILFAPYILPAGTSPPFLDNQYVDCLTQLRGDSGKRSSCLFPNTDHGFPDVCQYCSSTVTILASCWRWIQIVFTTLDRIFSYSSTAVIY